MNLSTIDKENKYYSGQLRSGTTANYKQRYLNRGSLTFSVYVFKDRVYKSHSDSRRDFRKSSKIPSILFSRYKFGTLKEI